MEENLFAFFYFCFSPDLMTIKKSQILFQRINKQTIYM